MEVGGAARAVRRSCASQGLQVEAAREAGFNIPRTELVRTAKDLIAFAKAESYPIILKPAECVPIYQGRAYSCRKWVCGNRAELDRAIDQWQEHVPLLAQNFITGIGQGLFGLGAPEGVRAWSGHHRVRMMNPQGSGSSACAAQSVADDIKSQGQQFIRNSGAGPVHDRAASRRGRTRLVC